MAKRTRNARATSKFPALPKSAKFQRIGHFELAVVPIAEHGRGGVESYRAVSRAKAEALLVYDRRGVPIGLVDLTGVEYGRGYGSYNVDGDRVATSGDSTRSEEDALAKFGRLRNPGGKHMACGDLSAKDCRQLQHVYESARDRGFSKERAAQQAWGSLANPSDMRSRAVVLFDDDGFVVWRGTLGEFFDVNDVSHKRVMRHLDDEGEANFGGGASPLFTLKWDDRAANPGRRRRNGSRGRRKNGAGLGAFLGSLIGSAVGMGVASVPLAVLGSIGGGAIGGHLGAPKDRRRRGSIGGAAGGALLGPIGAAVGGYIGGREADKQSNPRSRRSNRSSKARARRK